MTLFQIAVSNIRRRMSKMIFILLGLVIGISTTVSVFSVLETMKSDMILNMSEYGANIVITADKGAISFSYGGIIIPDVLFDVKKLTSDDLAAIENISLRSMIRIIAPKILGVVSTEGRNIIVAGSDLESDFKLKPWLLLQDSESGSEISQLQLTGNNILLGSIVSDTLDLKQGDTLQLEGQSFSIVGVLRENGSAEDNQVMMNLAIAQDLLKRQNEVNVIELAVDYNLGSEESLLAQLTSVLPDAKITALRQVVLGQDELLSKLSLFGTLVSILILIVGILVVSLTMSSAVRERTREIGIFRAIGFRKSHITKILLIEGFILSIVGGLIGYIIGTTIAGIVGPYLANASISVPWRFDILLGAILLSIIIGALSSLYSARQAAKLDPINALRFI